MKTIDPLDARILLALDDDPGATILQLAKVLEVSRNTVHARLQRMERANLLLGFSQRVSPASLGYSLVAFLSLAISQSEGANAMSELQNIPEVVEVHATTGEADLLAKVVARDTEHLYRIANTILAIEGVVRSNTAMSLSQAMPNRTRGLLEVVAHSGS
ncbi:Lrp/AsnC family transcriptional regulator [Streptomyces luteolifulvus]|uniref:Lrp/AsnC family transcriptional regulator n=1 Tax=Streptomyces luteolifulvus TaxID=2615112 RepID=A0A6H9UQV3_9ACTN|nr:Lrp/AsnC family transcriptional regulator [Streptomyces luteolifulvus]KAB1139975.1 Lrp/AsnC family transcriptional regulator [Streptomyces luteolifulvus]